MAGRNELRQRGNPLISAQDIMQQMVGDAAPTGAPEIIERVVEVEKVVEVVVADPNALIPQGGGVYVYKRFVMTPTGMTIPEDADGDEWLEVGQVVRGLESSIQWIIGDWAAFGERQWGESYKAAAVGLGYEVETLYTYAGVCRAIETSIRNRGLTFGHHRLVVRFDSERQGLWLAYAQTHQLKVAEMRADIMLMERIEYRDQLALLAQATAQAVRIIQLIPEELAAPALPKPTKEQKIAGTYSEYIWNTLPDLERLDRQGRAEVAKRAVWLSQWYANIAERAQSE